MTALGARSAAVTEEVLRLRRLVDELTARTGELQAALDSRVVIEQAKGVLAERLGLSPDEAFELMRSAARSHRLRLRALATDVVGSPGTPPSIEVERQRGAPAQQLGAGR